MLVCVFLLYVVCVVLCLLFLSVGDETWDGHTFVFASVLFICILYLCLLALFAVSPLSVSMCPNSFNLVNSFEYVYLIGWFS